MHTCPEALKASKFTLAGWLAGRQALDGKTCNSYRVTLEKKEKSHYANSDALYVRRTRPCPVPHALLKVAKKA